MRTRDVAVQGGVAALALVAAWVTWQRPVARPAADVPVLDVPVEQLSSVRYASDGGWVELTREADGGVLTTLSARPAVLPAGTGPDGRLPDGGTAAPLVEARPERTLRGSDAAAALLERLAPLRAARALGVLDAEGLARVGLDAPGQRLQLSAGGRTHAFTLSTAVVGVGSPYLRREADGQVFLLGPGLVADLEAASTRLVERRMHAFRPQEPDALVVERAGARRAFVQRAAPGQPARLSPRESPEAVDERATTWHDRVWNSAPVVLYGRGERPPGGEPRVEVRLTYARAGQPLGFLELASDGKGTAFARSELTAGWVSLPQSAGALLEEGTRVVLPTP